MNLTIPNLSLVVLIGASGSGKSTFARTHFRPTEILSSDFYRGLVADDENDQGATSDAFDVLHYIGTKRLAAGRLTVVDATNVQPEARRALLALAKEHDVLPVAIVLDLPGHLCQERNRERPERQFGPHVVRNHVRLLRQSLRHLKREGFRYIYTLRSPEEIAAATVVRQPLWTDRRHEAGPFDIIGDVHGCFTELVALLGRLGYAITREIGVDGEATYAVVPPPGRKAVFLGDLGDRGPDTPGVYRLVMGMVEAGIALCVPGNHDVKLLRKLGGRDVQITHGLGETLAQLDNESAAFRSRIAAFLDRLVGHYVLAGGALVVAHAGMKEHYQGRGSARVREFALYGETTGETDEFGLPVRYDWAAEYRGRAAVVYGHTPTPHAEWLNNTINIDTGCVFGGALTALRWPERELVATPATRTWAEPARPFLPTVDPAPALSAQQEHDDLLDVGDLLGKRLIETRLARKVTIAEERAITALEVMSRFAVDPKWLIYLPPTMSPAETSASPDLLEGPAEVFAYYRHEGVPRVICEEKHMGSRAVIVICRDEEAARRRFGVVADGFGICYTRTGRRFFDDRELERAFLCEVRDALGRADFWAEFATDWACLDCELLPWSAKAQELLRGQYAAVGAAATISLATAVESLAGAAAHGIEVEALQARFTERATLGERYVAAYGRYCWPVASLADLKLAPFHLLATEGRVHLDRDHTWHMSTLARLCRDDGTGLFHATKYRLVDVTDPADEAAAARWWEELTGNGGEGMVVKPLDPIVVGRRGLVQPAIKCRGREYLRIIYGPEYDRQEHLARLKARRLGAKRSLAGREFALGVEALERFVRREPLRRVHECVFGVLALESEPVDPRL
ncbi:MAG TPA: polynucleotide kinase-phosphatase [Thermomicrobiales bacterium]|jgi:protein phosphatase